MPVVVVVIYQVVMIHECSVQYYVVGVFLPAAEVVVVLLAAA
jgi:hypothetical protein